MGYKLYAVIDEYAGGYVGTKEQVIEWLINNDCTHGDQIFYEVGKQVHLAFEFIEEEQEDDI